MAYLRAKKLAETKYFKHVSNIGLYSKPVPFPQFANVTVPIRFGWWKSVQTFTALITGILIGGSQLEKWDKRGEDIYANLKFSDKEFTLLNLAGVPLSYIFTEKLFRNGSTKGVRTMIALYASYCWMHFRLPTFTKNAELISLPKPSDILKQVKSSPYPEPAFSKLLTSESTNIKENFENKKDFPPVHPLAILGALNMKSNILTDTISAFTAFPMAVLKYHWVEGGKQKYDTEWRAFVEYIKQSRKNLQLQTPALKDKYNYKLALYAWKQSGNFEYESSITPESIVKEAEAATPTSKGKQYQRNMNLLQEIQDEQDQMLAELEQFGFKDLIDSNYNIKLSSGQVRDIHKRLVEQHKNTPKSCPIKKSSSTSNQSTETTTVDE